MSRLTVGHRLPWSWAALVGGAGFVVIGEWESRRQGPYASRQASCAGLNAQ